MATQLRGSVGQTTFRVVNGRQVVQSRGGGGTRVFPDAKWQEDFFEIWPVMWAEAKLQNMQPLFAAAYERGGPYWNSLMGALLLAPETASGPTFPVQVGGGIPGPGWRDPPGQPTLVGQGSEGLDMFQWTVQSEVTGGIVRGRIVWGSHDNTTAVYAQSTAVDTQREIILVEHVFRHTWAVFAGEVRDGFQADYEPVVLVAGAPARPSRYL